MITKKGFTLSEVMITLGLVGVLAAILIPATTKVTPSTNKLMAKKANYTIQKAIANMINDDKNYPGDTLWPSSTVPMGFGQGTSGQFCTSLADQMNTVGATTLTVPCSFTTTDGIVWKVPAVSFSNADVYNTYIVADVNPKTAGCTTDTAGAAYATGGVCTDTSASCKGNPDTFIFSVRYDGKIKLSKDGGNTDACLNTILSNPTDNLR